MNRFNLTSEEKPVRGVMRTFRVAQMMNIIILAVVFLIFQITADYLSLEGIVVYSLVRAVTLLLVLWLIEKSNIRAILYMLCVGLFIFGKIKLHYTIELQMVEYTINFIISFSVIDIMNSSKKEDAPNKLEYRIIIFNWLAFLIAFIVTTLEKKISPKTIPKSFFLNWLVFEGLVILAILTLIPNIFQT